MGLLDTLKSLFGGKPQKKTAPAKSRANQGHHGKITYFNHKKGFGFITIKDTDQQVFLHISEINGRPRKGLMVDFDIAPDAKGDRATNVVPSS
ncbi:MAG: cold shock domain-containing protein [Saprospiraceae bacterium]|nr:cold shock domain-containing protein [Saprospiraceae bacterium]